MQDHQGKGPHPEVKVDKDFANLIPPHSAEELADLAASLKAEGCRDPLDVWKGSNILLDGHTRLKLCRAHDIPFCTRDVDLPDREAAARWIVGVQLARRNLPPAAMAELRGRYYNRTKGKRGGNRKSKYHDDTLKPDPVRDHLAEAYGVSPATIQRDGQFAEALDTLEAIAPGIEDELVGRNSPGIKPVIDAAAQIRANPDQDPEPVIMTLRQTKRRGKSRKRAHSCQPHSATTASPLLDILRLAEDLLKECERHTLELQVHKLRKMARQLRDGIEAAIKAAGE